MQKPMTSGLPSTWPSCEQSLRLVLSAFEPNGELNDATIGWGEDHFRAVLSDWSVLAREDQMPPSQAQGGGPWTSWIVMGGRGAGKTRTGAEWLAGVMRGEQPFAVEPAARAALIAETAAEARDVMVEGVSGLLAVHRSRSTSRRTVR